MKTNRSAFSIFFYPNTSKTKKSGVCPIVGRITVDGKNTTFSTGVEIMPNDWDNQSGVAKEKSKESLSLNKQIEQFRNEISSHYKDMVTNHGYVTAEALKNALRGIGVNRSTLMQETICHKIYCVDSGLMEKALSNRRAKSATNGDVFARAPSPFLTMFSHPIFERPFCQSVPPAVQNHFCKTPSCGIKSFYDCKIELSWSNEHGVFKSCHLWGKCNAVHAQESCGLAYIVSRNAVKDVVPT